MIFVIMLGMGASLTPRDFALALKRPYGLIIGVASQYGFMPFIAFLLAISLPVPDPIKIGILIMGCMPGGTTSNIFTYFSKGNLALSVLMTVNSTVFGVVLIPLVLVIYAGALDLQIPRENIIATLVLLLVPVAIGMGLRKLNANAGAVTEFLGSLLAVFFILFLIVSWIPRNWDFLMTTSWATYFGAIACWACSALPSATALRAAQAASPQCPHHGTGNRHSERATGHCHHSLHLLRK
jgi:BASS family bile acid:Na+ symporter